jgi:hypothetical protein
MEILFGDGEFVMASENLNIGITSEESWEWLRKELEPALRADESEFVEVSARDVTARNKKKKGK